MGIRKQMAKGVGYAVAPKLTFSALNPGKAAAVKATSWAVDRVTPSRRRRSKQRKAMTGIGAAAIAVPMGIWLGRRYLPSRQRQMEGGGY